MRLLLQGKTFEPEISISEVTRYLGYKGNLPEGEQLDTIMSCAAQAKKVATPRFVCTEFNLNRKAAELTIENTGFALMGTAITEHLARSQKCLMLAATLGTNIEKMIRYQQSASPHKAVIIDACANAMIEDYCDRVQAAAENEACSEAETLTWRFSPGYGDLALDTHRWLLPLLDTGRGIGLYETGHHFLTPQKSVTAFMGVIDKQADKGRKGCEACQNREICNYRKEGPACGN